MNDHGYYSIYLNGTDAEHLYGRYTGRSGCGGGYAKFCEKLHGLVGFAGGLPEGTHQVTLVNESPSESGGNVTFFGECSGFPCASFDGCVSPMAIAHLTGDGPAELPPPRSPD